MSRAIVPACVLGVFLVLFGSVIFQPHALIFRDAAHFYYPLFELVQEEWNAGRVPLWNPYENAGEPLLGNPTASVFYPLKAVFFLPLPYATLYNAYILVHVLLCAATAYALARHWGASVGAAGLCALGYAFSAVVFFQYANVVFLCGASWIPMAVLAADGALRGRSWTWAAGFAAVLALQVLGGDPEAAYLCGLLAAAYAVLLWWRERRGRRRAAPAAADGAAHGPHRLLLLAGMAIGSLMPAAVQIVPSWEFARRSVRSAYETPRNLYETAAKLVQTGRVETAGMLGRATDGPHRTYEFSTGPWRWPELVWPNVNGRQFPVNTRWVGALRDETTVWVPSLYMGVLPIVLAAIAWRWRGAEPHIRWLQGMVVLGLVGALGRFGVVWLLRLLFGPQFAGSPAEVDALGDEVGGLYWLLNVTLPGFVNFRYPSKLLVFAALGIAGLAAAGWDRTMRGDSRGLRRGLVVLLGLSTLMVAGVGLGRRAILAELQNASQAAIDRYYGPLDVEGAWSCMAFAGLHTGLVAWAAWSLVKLHRGPSSATRSIRGRIARAVPALLLVLLAADLAVANRWLVLAGPQSVFATTPRALEIIRRAEAEQGDGQPYRVHRTLFYAPLEWAETGSPKRHREGFRWERDTLSAKYGLPYDVQYTIVAGTMAQYDYEFFVAPWHESTSDMVRLYRIPREALVAPGGYQWTYYPQRGFDYWNTKYFLLPWRLADLQGRPVGHLEHRGIVSFLFDSAGKPVPRIFPSSPDEEETARRMDLQVLRNPDASPRAWIVHRLHAVPPVSGRGRASRAEIMESLLIDGAPDLRQAALVERDDYARAEAFHHRDANPAGERCRVVRYGPQRVEIAATLNAPGMLVLADAYYPGWRAEVDGAPAEIFRVNRMMRGVGLQSGTHHIVFRYRPASFWWGGRISAVAWVALVLLLVVRAARRRRERERGGR